MSFCDKHLDELMDFIDVYADLIRDSAMQDAVLWPAEHHYPDIENERPRHTDYFNENVAFLKDWILNRIEGMKSSPNFLLY